MSSFRVNNIKFSEDKLSDGDLIGLMEHTAQRLYGAGDDMALLGGIAIRRGIYPMESITSIDQAREVYGEEALFDGPTVA